MSEQYESIKNPSHYDHPTLPDLQAYQVAAPFGYNIGTAMVYLWRAGRKPGEPIVKDLRKAIEHIQFEIQRLENR